MSYFANFPSITYDFTVKADSSPIIQSITDITTKIEFNISDIDMETLCQRYIIQNTELPEHISNKFYKNVDHAWTILVINLINNLANEWPISDLELVNYTTLKYGASNIYTVHHYEKLPEGIQMDQSFILSMYGQSSLNVVTNLDYETSLNENKRIIWLIRPEYINDFITQYNSALGL